MAGYCSPRAPHYQLFDVVDGLNVGMCYLVINGYLTRSRLFGQPEPLLFVGKNLFRGDKEPEGTIVFFSTGTGDMAVAGGGLHGIGFNERGSLAFPFFRATLLALFLFFFLSSLPFALVWFFLKLLVFLQNVRQL